MAAEPLVEVKLVFQSGLAYRLEPYADGFALCCWASGESGQFRHWWLGVGNLSTTSDNQVRAVTVHGCQEGVVALPAGASVEVLDAEVRARLHWPCEVSARIERDGGTARYELELQPASTARWVRLAAADAWIGLSESGDLCTVVCTAKLPSPRRIEMRLPAERYAASLQAGKLFRVEIEPAGVDGWRDQVSEQEMLESARGNAWLELGSGRFQSLMVYDVETENAPVVDRDAPDATQFHGWQTWPAEVQALRWRDDDRTVVGVRFGTAAPEQWTRLAADLWLGSTDEQEIVWLVFATVEESSGRPDRLGDADWDGEPAESARDRALIESTPRLRFVVYGLVGELGAPDGFGAGWGGIPSSLRLGFGDEASARWLVVTSSRDADLDLAWRNAIAVLVPHGAGPEDHSDAAIEAYFASERERQDRVEAELGETGWDPITIQVDGVAVEFRHLAHGDRWAALTRIEHTTITLVGHGYTPTEVALETITDIAAHVEYARQRERERIERRLVESGISWQQYRPSRTAEERARRVAVRTVVDELTDALHRNAGAPDPASLFTDSIVQAWGGGERYQQLLLLHTMLRPISGTGTSGDYPTFHVDGSAEMRISVNHAASATQSSLGGFILRAGVQGREEPEPEPDRSAIRRGEQHHITLRLVPGAKRWLIDTDLLAILIDRLGTIEEVVRPLSDQAG